MSASTKDSTPVVTKSMADGTVTQTGSKNTRSLNTSSAFNQTIIIFLGGWAIASVTLLIGVLIK